MSSPRSKRAAGGILLIDANQPRAAAISRELSGLGVAVDHTVDAEDGWQRFAEARPSAVIAAIDAGKGGAWFQRRLETEFMGQLPAVYLLANKLQLDEVRGLDPTAILVPPVPRTALAAIAADSLRASESDMKQSTRLRELYELTLLGNQLGRSLDALAARAALTFRVDDVVLWGPSEDGGWMHSARQPPGASERGPLLATCRLASTVASTLMTVPASDRAMAAEQPGLSVLAVALGDDGGMALVSDGARRFSAEERDALLVLSRRLAAELAWLTAHERLLRDHETLRESAMLDPLLGVLNRAALERSIEGQIQTALRRNEPLTIAVVDLLGLRMVNERHGHQIGDQLLSQFASLVRSGLRAQDQVGRVGGSELAVLLAGADLERSRLALDHVLATLGANALLLDQGELPLDVTVGMSLVRTGETSGERAVARARQAIRLEGRRPGHIAEAVSRERDGSDDDLLTLDGPVGLPAGSNLGGMYRILHELSRGAMGVVYRAEDLGLSRPVAIKVLRSDLARDADLVARFRSEASLLASLRHRNLVQVYAFGAERDEVFFVMELVEGEPLSDVIARLEATGELIDLDVVATIVDEIADALDAMHALGIVHRDVKPANVLLDRVNDRAVLVDVGVAKRSGEATDAAGTPGYSAPESFMNVDETAAADVYGLATTVYAMLTGVPPFGGGELSDLVARQLYERPAAPSALRPGLTEAADTVLFKALAGSPDDRFASASAFAVALGRALARETTARLATSAARASGPIDPASVSYPMPPIASAEVREPACRGVLFRVAARLMHHELGAAWIARISELEPGLAPLLAPTLPAMSWQLLSDLHRLLLLTVGQADGPHALARRLGRATMTATLSRFFGADPAALPPGVLLRASEAFWSRYHNWSQLSVTERSGGAVISVAPGPGEPVLCAMLEGSFGRMAEMANASDVTTSHPSCGLDSGEPCVFDVAWR